MNKRDMLMQSYPWKVPEGHRGEIYRLLELHGEYILDAGKGMAEGDLADLKDFYTYLRENDVVVEYDPWAAGEKWTYQPRTPEDDDMLIRANRHTEITETGQIIWSFPPWDPGEERPIDRRLKYDKNADPAAVEQAVEFANQFLRERGLPEVGERVAVDPEDLR